MYPNMGSLMPQMMNPMCLLNQLTQWPNYQGLNQIAQAKMNKLNFMNTSTPYNWASILALLQQNGANTTNL